MDLLGESHLFDRKICFSSDRRPGRCRVAALQVLLILLGVAGLAVGCREPAGDREAFMIERLLPFAWLVAVKAVDSDLVMLAHVIFMDNSRGFMAMAVGALAGRLDQGGAYL